MTINSTYTKGNKAEFFHYSRGGSGEKGREEAAKFYEQRLKGGKSCVRVLESLYLDEG
jgi:hypothetical protein